MGIMLKFGIMGSTIFLECHARKYTQQLETKKKHLNKLVVK